MIARVAAVALVALALVASAGGATTADPGVTSSTVLLGGTVPLTGEAAAFGTVGPGREGLLRLREREGRRQRPEDRVPLLRRRLQPRADGPAHTPARRAGQGLRDLQLHRHGEQPRDPRVPERAEGAAALRRRRLAVDRPQLRAVPVDDGLPPELPRRGRRLRQDHRGGEAESTRRRPLREHRARPRHADRPDAAIAGKGPRIVAKQAYEFTDADVSRRSRS